MNQEASLARLGASKSRGQAGPRHLEASQRRANLWVQSVQAWACAEIWFVPMTFVFAIPPSKFPEIDRGVQCRQSRRSHLKRGVVEGSARDTVLRLLRFESSVKCTNTPALEFPKQAYRYALAAKQSNPIAVGFLLTR